jgi:predicted secreted protein
VKAVVDPLLGVVVDDVLDSVVLRVVGVLLIVVGVDDSVDSSIFTTPTGTCQT